MPSTTLAFHHPASQSHEDFYEKTASEKNESHSVSFFHVDFPPTGSPGGHQLEGVFLLSRQLLYEFSHFQRRL